MLGDYGMDTDRWFHKLDTLKEEDTFFNLDMNYEQLESSSGEASLPINDFPLDSSVFSSCNDFSFVSCGKKPNATPDSSPQIPTPPQSPFSDEALELDNLLAEMPEIYDSSLPPKLNNVDDILRDLQTSSSPLIEIDPLILGSQWSSVEIYDKCRTISESDNEHLRPIKKDSMWGAGVPFSSYEEQTMVNLKPRSFSESSDDFKHHSCGFSEHDGIEYFPDTPCGSDEDGSNSPRHYNKYGSAVNSEHNYCEMAPVENHKTQCKATRDVTDRLMPKFESEILHQNLIENETDSEEDIEVDVVSINDAATPLLSSLVGLPCSILPSSAPTISSTSADVKRQLQAALQASIRNKRGRGSGRGRPPKVRTELEGNVLKGVQHKSTTLSKRILTDETHMSRRRKTTALDPDDDIEKRSNHNIMERNRRVNIKNLFDELRLAIDDIKTTERSSKVLILSKAREQIKALKAEQADNIYEVECHIRLNEYLTTKYNWLKSVPDEVKKEPLEDMMM